jgi:hypothetical protein
MNTVDQSDFSSAGRVRPSIGLNGAPQRFRELVRNTPGKHERRQAKRVREGRIGDKHLTDVR